MKLNIFQFVPRPRFLLLGLCLFILSSAGIFHQKTSQYDVYGKLNIQHDHINLHEITVRVPISKDPVKKTVCNVKVTSGLWEVMLLTHPDKTNEFVIAGNKKNHTPSSM